LAGKVEHEDKFVRLGNLDHKKPEILALNPNGQVPFITVDGQPIIESAVILRYLCITEKSLARFYSEDPSMAAKIDEVLDFNGTVFRPNIVAWLKPYVIKLLMRKTEFSPDLLEMIKQGPA